jgi:hypothetical protein
MLSRNDGKARVVRDEDESPSIKVGESRRGETRNGQSKKGQAVESSQVTNGKNPAQATDQRKGPEQSWFSDSGMLSAVLNAAQWPLDYIEKKTGQGQDHVELQAVPVKDKTDNESAPPVIERIISIQRLEEAKKNTIPAKSIYYKDIATEAAACLSKQKAARKATNEPPGGKNGERGLWKDPDFGPEDSSLSPGLVRLALKPTIDGVVTSPHGLGESIRQIVGKDQSLPWKIPRDFSTSRKQPGHREDGEGTWVYVDVADMLESAKKPAASTGNATVNRYFATALILAVQNNPLFCDSLIDITHEAQGIYGVSLHVDGKWSMVWIDSFFPCLPVQSGAISERARPVFPSITDPKEIWTLVVEKAIAKLHRSYEGMLHAPLSLLLEQVTGGDANYLDLCPLRSSANSPGTVWKQIEKSVMARGGGGLFGGGSNVTFVAATSRPAPKDPNGNPPEVAMNGIGHGFTYAVVAAVDASGQRLLRLRAPPGAGEWTGDWSAGSGCWDGEKGAAVRAAADAVGSTWANDGDFWISFQDFVQRFEGLVTLRTKVSADEAALRAKILDCVHEAGVGRAALSPGLEMRYRHLMQRAVADRMAEELLKAEAPKRKKAGKPGKPGKAPGKGSAKAKAEKVAAERSRVK